MPEELTSPSGDDNLNKMSHRKRHKAPVREETIAGGARSIIFPLSSRKEDTVMCPVT